MPGRFRGRRALGAAQPRPRRVRQARRTTTCCPGPTCLPYGPDMTTYFFKDTNEEDPSKRYKGLVRTGSTTTPGMVFDLYFSAGRLHVVPVRGQPHHRHVAQGGPLGADELHGMGPDTRGLRRPRRELPPPARSPRQAADRPRRESRHGPLERAGDDPGSGRARHPGHRVLRHAYDDLRGHVRRPAVDLPHHQHHPPPGGRLQPRRHPLQPAVPPAVHSARGPVGVRLHVDLRAHAHRAGRPHPVLLRGHQLEVAGDASSARRQGHRGRRPGSRCRWTASYRSTAPRARPAAGRRPGSRPTARW